MKRIKYFGIAVVLLAVSVFTQQLFFKPDSISIGRFGAAAHFVGFLPAASIVFFLSGLGGFLGGCFRVGLQMRKSEDLNLLRTEIVDLLAYGFSVALSLLFFGVYLSFQ